MAWPSALARTKDWVTEVLTDTDLEGQFDLIITYVNDMMDSSTGHKHDGTTSEGPKILISDLNLSSGAQGDILQHDGSNLVRLPVGSARQLLQVNSGATDVEYTSEAKITDLLLTETTAPTTAASEGALYTKDESGQPELFFREESDGDEVQITSAGSVLGGTALFSDVLDYGTSASASTAKSQSDLKVCYGKINVGATSTTTISNLPFTSTSSYVVMATFAEADSPGQQNCAAEILTASTMKIGNNRSSGQDVFWYAIGT